ncbi:diguanylate cyclase [Thiomicrorhabdus sp. zzn3]|uniref:diguanylate cyclase domain-containing protein n=1 Tax=Thiomicrorhabdus sp. zzn3 TaxID=3039775 RepID=UPI002436C6BA|nr:diguanylate cyclase [Thiomicrorhabdus sp. zzn3]MDG6778387.1 diguanylate cyclase [Thiomicrorhabdus sp. zzn3]
MQDINGYSVQRTLGTTRNSQLLLASHTQNMHSLVFKTSKDEYTSKRQTQELVNEFELLKGINHSAILQIHGVESLQGRTFLLREYFDGISLESYLSQAPLELEMFLDLAIQLADAIEALHHQEIVHGNLTPSCILLNPDDLSIKLTGFGNAARRLSSSDSGEQRFSEYELLYKAPEQSQIVNQQTGYAADIYALGVIFFQMLSGRLPFDAQDVMTLAHSHMAKPVPALNTLIDTVPEAISDMISLMLTKSHDERYSSVTSLKKDLEHCRDLWQGQGEIVFFKLDRFTLAASQQKNSSPLPLYGREQELSRLTGLIKQTSGIGKASMITVKGGSGVGKSRLVDAAFDQLEAFSGYCLKAKFDQYKPAAPYELLYSALGNLIAKVLTEGENELDFWKRKLSEVLGQQAQLLMAGIPELEWLLGPQPQAEPLSPSDAKSRLNLLINGLIQAFAQPDQTVFLILDDLQWADAATLEWLEVALEELSYFVVIAAYRDNEVPAHHPFARSLHRLADKGIEPEEIALSELNPESVLQMVSDSMPVEDAAQISEAIYRKTGGNAFYVTEYLKQLQSDKIVYFDAQSSRWVSDLNKLQQLPASENIVEFLSARITCFPDQVQQLLKIASCIGNRFEAALLRRLYQDDVGVDRALQTALAEGWLRMEAFSALSESVYYLFTHDRIQQAVWSLLHPDEKERLHLLIGQTLLELYQPLEKEKLYECVNHLNAAFCLQNEEDERCALAELNFSAASQAKLSGDFELALSYIRQACEWMPKLEQHPNYVDFLRERAECEHLCNHDDKAIQYYSKALQASDDSLVKARVYELMVTFYTDISQFDVAYRIGRDAVQMFDINLPQRFNPGLFVKDLLVLKSKLRKYPVAGLLELPEARDEQIKMAIRLLSVTLKAAYQVKPELCVAISLKVVRLCLDYGNTREAVIGYIVFGIIFQSGVLGKHKIGYEYGQLSLALLERFGNQLQKAEVEFVFGYFAHSWSQPAASTEVLWHSAYKHGLEVGDWFHTGCAAAGIVQSLFMRGKPFVEIESEIERFSQVLQRIGAQEQLGAILSVRQAIRNLRGQTESERSFSEQGFDEAPYVDSLSEYGSRHFAHYYFVNKMATLYLHQAYDEAMEISLKSRTFLGDSKGMLHAEEHHFITALIQAQLMPQAGPLQRRKYQAEIKRTVRRFKRWAVDCAENFLARQRVLEGEFYRLKRDYPKALRCYDSAIEAANIYGQYNMAAIANRLAADVYKVKQQNRAAELYSSAAEKAFERWGIQPNSNAVQTQDLFEVSALDVITVMKATEVIAREKRLSELLETLVQIIIENAGAQRGVLLMHEDQRLLVQAEASVDTEEVRVMQRVSYHDNPNLVQAIVNYVLRTEEPIVLDNAGQSAIFGQDAKVVERQVVSVLCIPLKLHGQVKGVVYLENNSMSGVFTKERIELLKLLSGHIAIAIDNAQIYDQLERKVAERTQDLDAKNEMLKKQNVALQKQNDRISELNELVVKENEERKKVEVKLHEAIEELNRLATTDALTHLNNRRGFDDYLQRECARHNRSDKALSLMLCDIDLFKAYNDHYGHQQGDACLKLVADVLLDSILRPSDFVARFGGEEFVIVMPDTPKEGALQVAERIHDKLKVLKIPHVKSEVMQQVTMSIGIATSNQGETCMTENLIEIADKALYRAKALGRNQTVCGG